MELARPRRVGRPQGPAPDPAVRRTELLDAATRAIRRGGPNTSMDEIASEAGLTKPILYTYFGGKAGLAEAMAERLLNDLLPSVLAALTQERPPREMVRQAIDTFVGFVEGEPELYRFLVRGVAGAERSFIEQPFVAEFGLRLADVFRAAFVSAGRSGEAAELSAFAILGTVLAGAEWWHVRSALQRDALVDQLTDLVWSGLSSSGLEVLGAAQAFSANPKGTDER